MITIKSNNVHAFKGLCSDCIFVAAKCAEDGITECPYFAKEQYIECPPTEDSEPIILSRVEMKLFTDDDLDTIGYALCSYMVYIIGEECMEPIVKQIQSMLDRFWYDKEDE